MCNKNTFVVFFLHSHVIFLFKVQNWFLWTPSDGNMRELSNLNGTFYRDTCTCVYDYGSSTLIRGQLVPYYTVVNVTIVTSGGGVLFGPLKSSDAWCDSAGSILMTHSTEPTSTPTPTRTPDEKCKPFCEVPTSCHHHGSIGIADGYTAHHFSCKCPHQWCNELLVWLRKGSFKGKNAVCQIHVEYD